MSSHHEKLIQKYLSEESSDSICYDSNSDTEYVPTRKRSSYDLSDDSNTSFTRVAPGTQTSLPELSNIVVSGSDDEISVEVSSSDDDCNLSDSDSWVDFEKDIPNFNFDTDLSGIKLIIPESAKNSPIDLFKLLWTDEIFNIIVNSTNNYGEKNKYENRPHNKYSRKSSFKKTNKEEMQNFFGICLLLGSVKFSVLRDSFSNNPLYYHLIIKKTISGRRFEQLLNAFSVEYSDIEICDDGPMRKINPVYKLLIKKFQTAFYPNTCLSLDESLLLHRGRLGFRQFIKGKKAKYGIKFYELCTPDGYVLNIDMYKGKNDKISVVPSQTSKIDDIVIKLMSPYLDKGHVLHDENAFNAIEKFAQTDLLDIITEDEYEKYQGIFKNNRSKFKILEGFKRKLMIVSDFYKSKFANMKKMNLINLY